MFRKILVLGWLIVGLVLLWDAVAAISSWRGDALFSNFTWYKDTYAIPGILAVIVAGDIAFALSKHRYYSMMIAVMCSIYLALSMLFWSEKTYAYMWLYPTLMFILFMFTIIHVIASMRGKQLNR